MAKIKISDLHPTGSDLFSDSESYMSELIGDELNQVYGGGWLKSLVAVGGGLIGGGAALMASGTSFVGFLGSVAASAQIGDYVGGGIEATYG
jgi:hypothetical protein